MCTAVSFVTKDHYFGRNLDYEFSYEESVVITPRNYKFSFRSGKEFEGCFINGEKAGLDGRNVNGNIKTTGRHYAMIGVAYVVDEYPLYYDAVNEKGLGMAGLLFAGNAVYCDKEETNKDNIASYEFIPWILGQCADVEEAKKMLGRVHLMNWAFSKELPPTPLHWMIADKKSTIVVEAVADGLKIYDNPVHVLTNNPDFEYQLMNLNNYMELSPYEPENYFAKDVKLSPYSKGMGAMGLPGDLSSTSRFVKAAFTRMNSVCKDTEEESVSQFFHILGSVEQQRGCVRLRAEKRSAENADIENIDMKNVGMKNESLWEKQSDSNNTKYEITIYSCCCNTDKGIYYYTTYENGKITAVDMHKENLEGDRLAAYPLIKDAQISWQN